MKMNKHKNASIRKIEFISRFLLVASAIAMLFGVITICLSSMRLIISVNAGEPRGEYAEYIKEIAEGLVLTVHYFFVTKFLVTALKAEVPFTHEAAKEMRVIGWETIILPLLVIVVGLIAFAGYKPAKEIIEIEIFELVLGVFLIQTGYVIDYATDKAISGHKYHTMCRILNDRYPEIYKEMEADAKHVIYEETAEQNELSL